MSDLLKRLRTAATPLDKFAVGVLPTRALYAEAADEIERLRALTSPQLHQHGGGVDVDALAQEIRRVDGNHSLGAGALAEALLPFLTAALAQQPLSVQEGWQQALDKPFCVLFLDGRNEHGSHVLASYPRSFDTAETNIEDEAETILTEAEALGFSIGDHVWAEFDWTAPQIDNEGRTELTGYWEFKRINPEMTRAAAPTVGGKE